MKNIPIFSSDKKFKQTTSRMSSVPSFIAFLAILIFVFFSGFSNSFAQSKQERKENIEAMKISFITKNIDLTPDEAKVFWPVYNEYQSQLDALRSARKKVRQSAKEDFQSMSDTEVEKLVDGEISFRQSEIDLQKKYHAQFKKVLPVKKVALLYRAEEAFKLELIKKLQEK